MTSQNLKPLIELQQNASYFFNQFLQKHQAHMQCKAGCSQCCHVDLSLFEAEAMAILEWAENLSDEKQLELVKLLEEPEETSLYNKKKACVFLRKNQCTIYEARPNICRTQGAVLQYKKPIDKVNTQIYADVCPLNFTQKETFPEQTEWLDLDRLNSLQSIAENFYQKNMPAKEKRFNLAKNKDGRIALTHVKAGIMRMIKKPALQFP